VRHHHISAPMNSNLTDDDRADLVQFLREAIEADRYPLSPRVRRLKELLAKIDPAPRPPAPRPNRAMADRRLHQRRREALLDRP
jgi:hypothetical protein